MEMKIRFLGTGTSTGNPEIGCRCEVCTSSDRRDRRMRASLLLQTQGKNILIDCGPDFRWQILHTGITKIDAVLITHEHYDHVGGIDDLRPFCKFGDVDIYAEKYVSDAIQTRIPYAFYENKYPGVPNLEMHPLDINPFHIDGIEVTPVRIYHAKLPIFGYRIGNFAYLTDVKSIPDSEIDKLKDLEVLVIDALRPQAHISHLTTEESFDYIKKIKPKKAYLIHMSHHFGLHAEMEKKMPENVFISYDGLEITLPLNQTFASSTEIPLLEA